jgi:hypothetical protein
MIERWKEILDGYYEVSSLGRVRRIKAGPGAVVGRIRVPGATGSGYLGFVLSCNGRRKTCKAHILVAEAFLGPRPPGKEVNHKDGIKKHVGLANLEYLTKAEQEAHACRLGLKAKGERHGMSKLRNKDVREIRKIFKIQVPFLQAIERKKLQVRLGISCDTFFSVAKRHTWKHLK